MALNFDGVDDQVSHGDIAGIDGGTALTTMCWVNPDVIQATDVIVGKIQAGVNFSFMMGTGNATAAELEYHTPAGSKGNVAGVFVNGTWVHVACVYDGNGAANADRLKMYKDGVEQSVAYTGTIGASMPDSGANAVIVANPNGEATRDELDGTIAHLKMWTAVLTAAEVAQEMNSIRPVRTASLVVWSPYHDGTTAADYSGAGNHGTVTGALAADGPPVGSGFPVGGR